MLLGQLSLLLWKNLLFRRRHPVVTALEIILPTLLAIALAYLASTVSGPTGGSESVKENQKIFLPETENEILASVVRSFVDTGKSILAFTPDNPVTRDIMEKVMKLFPAPTFVLQGFSTEAATEKHVVEAGFGSSKAKIGAAIVFPNNLNSPSFRRGYEISYKIRLVRWERDPTKNYAPVAVETTKLLFPSEQEAGPDLYIGASYQDRGFTGLQIGIDKVLIEILTGKEPTQTMNTQVFPYPPYKESSGSDIKELLSSAIPIVIIYGFIFIVPSIIRNVLAEKETGIKELMKMMGLPNWLHWLGWMLNSLLTMALSIAIVTVLFFVRFQGAAVFEYTDPSLWFFVLILYAVAATSFCFFISTFFRRPALGITAGLVLWIVTYSAVATPMQQKYQFLNLSAKLASALIPNVALHWIIRVMTGFEREAVGARWSNIAEGASTTDELSVGYGCLMLILDTILYMTLTIYFENVLPSEFGIRKPWYYPFMASTWRRWPKTNRVAPILSENKEEDRPGFEEEPIGLRAGVVIHNLKKQFGRHHVAVNMVGTLKMYDGQITALLGHNGAGKTTTLSMLTGLFSPTSGTATVNGFDIVTSMDLVRKNLALCPQHNMLFNKLTVEQHLIFFGRLKGLSRSQAKNETLDLLSSLRLVEKRKALASDLSGGQKRKVSLGIALIGGTKVVVLDEPTSGMDPEARRGIWDLLLGMRGQRTIILTTHFMEEADVLGDRIAIMADGKVKCCGSPMFLKKYYGAGYTLKMTVENPKIVGSLLGVVQGVFPAAFIKSGDQNPNPSEVSITIPNESETNAEFPRLFTTLSDRKKELGILTLGLSLATMDDIFVKVGEVHESEEQGGISGNSEPATTPAPATTPSSATTPAPATTPSSATTPAPATTPSSATTPAPETELSKPKKKKRKKRRRMTGLHLTFHQFSGLLRKRMIYTLRKWGLLITQFLMPLFLLILSIELTNEALSSGPPPLKMDVSVYRRPVTLFRASPQSFLGAYRKIVGSSAQSKSRDLVDELLAIGRKDVVGYRERYIVAGDLNDSSVTAMFSSIPYHASPLSVNLMSNAILESMQGSKGHRIHVTNHPFPSSLLPESFNQKIGKQPEPGLETLFGTFVTLGLALFAASFIVFPIEERQTKAKQLQMMTDVSPIVYWGSSFLWDFCVAFLLACLMVTCLPIFQNFGKFTSYHGGGVFFLILIVFGFSAISFSYLCSTFVSTIPGGFSLVTIIHIATGILLSVVVYMLELSYFNMRVFRIIGRFFPAFGASLSVMRFMIIATGNSQCNIIRTEAIKKVICNPGLLSVPQHQRHCCPNCQKFGTCFKPEAYITWRYALPGAPPGSAIDGLGQDVFYLFLIGLFYKALLLVIEYGVVGRILALSFKTDPAIFQQRRPEDEDVLMENQRVAEMVATGRVNEDALVIENFCKSYGSFSAVAGLSFGVHHGECFGLLGVNGAGKTTSFRMLTGDEFRSAGNAFGNRLTLDTDRTEFLSLIGYCPQFDAIIGVLTGREMLQLFCSLRGVPSAEADKWLRKLGLLEAGNVQCQKYSGGMKRRLCAGMAMVGDPPIILLDEPTSGVDPIARRQFWKVVSSVRDAGQAVVLTSHSMDECEALCSRLGIMVNGQFQCLGGVQHLKNKFAQGFRLEVKLKMASPDEVTLNDVCDKIGNKFSPCTLKDKHMNIIEYQVTNTEISWGQIFQIMEDFRREDPELIEDYSVSETTLEEVFLSFARMQFPEGRVVKATCCQKLMSLLYKN